MPGTEGNGQVRLLQQHLEAAGRIVVLTGAGISTESGIPDFRSPGGLWTRGIKPITYQDFVASEEARLEDWRRRFRMNETFAAAKPNAGHLAIAKLEEEGRLSLLVTQNIDGLHGRAGVSPARIVEIHGNSSEGRCVACRTAMPLAAVKAAIETTGASPRCACGGLVKAAVISFGERVPGDLLRRAAEATERADLFVVLGSSLQVQPAANLPLIAKRVGARLAIVNRESTPLDHAADIVLHMPIGAVFSDIYPQLAKDAAANS